MRETGRVSHNKSNNTIQWHLIIYVLVRYPLVKILNEKNFLAKRGPDRITTVPGRAAGRGVPLQQSQCSFIIFFFLLITI
jgi:hypothetical protein